MNTFTIQEKKGETEYLIDANGAIKQLYPKKFTYDAKYCAIYDTPEYARKSLALQRIRSGIIQAVHDGPINRLLDVGYGNGAFLRHMRSIDKEIDLYGHDISGVQIPDDCHETEDVYYNVDVITFWDCLEHFPDLSFLSQLSVQTLVVSLPWCHYLGRESTNFSEEYFANWHHRKPNEHIYHFDKYALRKTMNMYGWEMIAAGNPEDVVRKSRDRNPNILTAAFKRK